MMNNQVVDFLSKLSKNLENIHSEAQEFIFLYEEKHNQH